MSWVLDEADLDDRIQQTKAFLRKLSHSTRESAVKILEDGSADETRTLCKVFSCLASGAIPIDRPQFNKLPHEIAEKLSSIFRHLDLTLLEERQARLSSLLHFAGYYKLLLHHLFSPDKPPDKKK
jgi:hypothetical protein